MKKWDVERAKSWEARVGRVRGCNYIPMNCANTTALWQKPDEDLIDKELGWAEAIGLNSLRVFMQYIVYESDPSGLLDRFGRFLDLAGRHDMTVMPVLFDDCWGPEPALGEQPLPVPGVHNSRWTASPGLMRTTPEHWPQLAEYVREVIGRFADDERVIAWDLYNETKPEHRPLLKSVFGWAREADPSQPLVACWEADDLCDLPTFHCYEDAGGEKFAAVLEEATESGRPALCTECLARNYGNTLEKLLPAFRERGIGWYVWGLVAGATQTRFPWGWPAGGPEPPIWFHDLLYPDGTPYDEGEIALLKEEAGLPD